MVEIRSCRISSSRASWMERAHRIEGAGEPAQFVVASFGNARAVFLLGDHRGRLIELPDRLQNAMREEAAQREPGKNRRGPDQNQFPQQRIHVAAYRVERMDGQQIAHRRAFDIPQRASQNRKFAIRQIETLQVRTAAVLCRRCARFARRATSKPPRRHSR